MDILKELRDLLAAADKAHSHACDARTFAENAVAHAANVRNETHRLLIAAQKEELERLRTAASQSGAPR